MYTIMRGATALPSAFASDASALESSISKLRTSIAGLERSINSLDQSSGTWEIFAWVCSLLVALGVALEIVTVIREHSEAKEEWARGILRPPSRPSVGNLAFDVAATLLVIIGVFGEAGASAALASKNSQLRSRTSQLRAESDQLLALVMQQTGAANQQAAEANERAAKNEKEAESERVERLKLEQAVAWRRLTTHQIDVLGSRLAEYPRQLTALVYNVGDVEAFGFASDIDIALHEKAKWNVGEPQEILKMREGPVPFGTNPPLARGVVVRSTSDERSTAAADTLIGELTKMGFDASKGEPITHTDRKMVEVDVEPRPEGPQGEAKLRNDTNAKIRIAAKP